MKRLLHILIDGYSDGVTVTLFGADGEAVKDFPGYSLEAALYDLAAYVEAEKDGRFP